MTPRKSPSRICSWANAPSTSRIGACALPTGPSRSNQYDDGCCANIRSRTSRRLLERGNPSSLVDHSTCPVQLGIVEYVDQLEELSVRADSQQQEAVGRRNRTIRRDARMVIAQALRIDARGQVALAWLMRALMVDSSNGASKWRPALPRRRAKSPANKPMAP